MKKVKSCIFLIISYASFLHESVSGGKKSGVQHVSTSPSSMRSLYPLLRSFLTGRSNALGFRTSPVFRP